MVKVDHLLVREGVASIGPKKREESREPEGPQDSVRKLTDWKA
jgi:hypothetical protein